jgi:hypothetical protein
VNIIQGCAGINPSDLEVIAILLIKLTHYGYDALRLPSRHSQSPPNANKGFSKRWGTVERDNVVKAALPPLRSHSFMF